MATSVLQNLNKLKKQNFISKENGYQNVRDNVCKHQWKCLLVCFCDLQTMLALEMMWSTTTSSDKLIQMNYIEQYFVHSLFNLSS